MISLCPSLITPWKLLQTILLTSRNIRPSNTCLVSHSHTSRPTRLLVTVCVLLEVFGIALAKSYLVLSLTYRDTLLRARSLSQQPIKEPIFLSRPEWHFPLNSRLITFYYSLEICS